MSEQRFNVDVASTSAVLLANSIGGSISSFFWAAVRRYPIKFIVFFASSILFAVSEGLSVTLIVPILETSGTASNIGALPILSTLTAPLRDMDPTHGLALIALLLACAVILRGAMQFLSNYLASLIQTRIQIDYMKFGYESLIDGNLWSMSNADTGSIQTAIREHTQRMGTVIQAVTQTIMSTTLIALYGALMLMISWQMTIASIAFVILTYFLLRKLSGPWFYWAGGVLSAAIQKIQQNIFETVSAMTLVKLRSAEAIMKRRFSEDAEILYRADAKRLQYMNMQSPTVMTMSGLFISFLLLSVSLLYSDSREVWAPTFIYFVVCLSRLAGPGSQIVTSHGFISSNTHSLLQFRDFIQNTLQSRLPKGQKSYGGLRGVIAFRGVTMSYDSGRGPALRDVTLSIKKNTTVALVGPSGAGKSTILALLMRMRDPSSGAIFVDDADLREFDVSLWRKKISIVSQSLVFFNDTVRNNLAFGLDGVTDQQIRHSLKVSMAEEFVDQLPHGIDTVLGEGGQTLSGGQRQRLAIARAIIADPEILVFDEATNQLDSVTEKLIQDMVELWSREKTVIVVAHRLSTIRNADCVYVLSQGQVVAEGRHEDLFKSSMIYKEMFETQRIGVL